MTADTEPQARPVLWVNDMPAERHGDHGFVYKRGRTFPVAVSFEAENDKCVRVSFDPATGDVDVQTLREAGKAVPDAR